MREYLKLIEPGTLGDFELLDTGDGYRLERWGHIFVVRPDPQIIWNKSLEEKIWNGAQAKFLSGKDGEKGKWVFSKPCAANWRVSLSGVKFLLKFSPFKHVGAFPEQAANWAWMINKLKVDKVHQVKSNDSKPYEHEKLDNLKSASGLKILNLFAYTGGATMALTSAGHFVTHVDASKPAIAWAKENQKINGFSEKSVRWILDDAVKFVKRELRRGVSYDGILMDPPAYGHSPTGKIWKFNAHLPELLSDCVKLLSQNAKFLLINGYATNSSALALNNLLEDAMADRNGAIEAGELCLKQRSGRLISTGIFARWHA